MVLSTLQAQLSALYEAPLEHQVADFLVTDAAIARALEDRGTTHSNAERLLLREAEDSLDVTLYIDREVLENLAHRDPYERLDRGNLNEFLIALEGVSHFHYLLWKAVHARQVTQLELELQAEVDKFVTASFLLTEQGALGDSDSFHDSMFNAVSFPHAQDAVSARRYREANYYAAKYCRSLTRRFPGQHRQPSFISELRRFYRLSQNEKIRSIERVAN